MRKICWLACIIIWLQVLPVFAAEIKVTKDSSLNILLFTLDTTRADRIGAYGYSQAKTPNLDALARQGVRFVRAYCPTPLTLPSHCTILTGTSPLFHKVRNNGFYYLSEESVTLAERLKEYGYKTAAVVASFNVDSRFGVAQGFDLFDDDFKADEMIKTFRSERRAEEVADSFIRWLDKNLNDKFFAWVHFYDPHSPYSPPPPYHKDFYQNPYDGEIAYMDFHLGRIIEYLKAKKILEKTLIVAVGDHGEALGEKEELDHGIFIYDPTMKVPLIFRAPNNFPQGVTVESTVRIMDLMPTILDLVKVPLNREIQGESLLPYIEGRKKGDLSSYIECLNSLETYGWSPLVGLVAKGWKYIQAPKPELYNLKNDPTEEKNLVDKEKNMLSEIKAELEQVIKKDSSSMQSPRRKLTLEEEERLRSLGYVGGEISAEYLQGELPDPKDRIKEFLILYQGMNYEWEGKLEEAEKKYREILGLQPHVAWRYLDLAIILSKRNKTEEAIEVLEKGLEIMPDSFVLLSRLAHFYMAAGRLKEAYETSQIVLEQDPKYLDALAIAGWVLDGQGMLEEAAAFLKRALEVEPENKLIRLKYAFIIAELGQPEEAVAIDEELKKQLPDDFRIYLDLGIIYSNMGRLDMAEENLRKALELNPSPDAHLNYAVILEKMGRLKEAVANLKQYLAKTKEGDTPRKRNAQKALEEWEKRIQ